MKAQPSRPRSVATSAPIRPRPTSATATHQAGREPPADSRNAITTTSAAGKRLLAIRAAPRRSSPVVRRARKTAPCRVNSSSVASPPSSANGLSRVNRVPVYSWPASSGTPRTMLANATPHRKAGPRDPQKKARSQPRVRSDLLRYSRATPRAINASRMRNSGR